VNEAEIQIAEPESLQALLEGRLHALRAMNGIPRSRSDKVVFARHSSSGKSPLQCLAHFALIPVSLRTIEVTKSGFQRVSGRSDRHGWIKNQSAKAQGGHLATAVVEGNSRKLNLRRFVHEDTCLWECRSNSNSSSALVLHAQLGGVRR
jgi:hypothetical protein